MPCIPAMRIIIVNPDANQTTRTQIAVVANPVLAVHGGIDAGDVQLGQDDVDRPEAGLQLDFDQEAQGADARR